MDLVDLHFSRYWLSELTDVQPVVRAMLSHNPRNRPRQISSALRHIFPDVVNLVTQWLQRDHDLAAEEAGREERDHDLAAEEAGRGERDHDLAAEEAGREERDYDLAAEEADREENAADGEFPIVDGGKSCLAE